MSRSKLIKFTKKVTSVVLSAAMVFSMIPEGAVNVAAADDEPYVVSAGRTVYSSSDNGNSTADNVVDGNMTTRWESVHGEDIQWLYVDLGKETDITSIFLKWEAAYAKSYKIQFSNDETNWEDVYIKGNADAGGEVVVPDITISYETRDTGIFATWTSIDNAKYKVCIDSDDNVAIAPDGYKFTGHGDSNGNIKLEPGTYKLIVIALDKTTGAELKRGEREVIVPEEGESLPEETDVTTEATATGNPLEHTINVTGKARFVRVYMTERATNYGYSLYEFQVYGLDGLTPRPDNYGTNLALNKEVKRSAIRDVWWMYDEAGNLKPESVAEVEAYNAVDGNVSTSFTSAEADNQWIYVDLGQNYEIGRIILKWAESAGKIYDIEVSNDAQNWTPVYRRINGYADLEENIPIYVESARYVRVYGYSRVNKNGDGFRLNELEVYPYVEGDEKVTYTLSELPKTEIVQTANGSYVSNDMHLTMTKTPAYIDEENIKVPIESNDWWQSAMIKQFGNTMSTLPFKATYSKKGLGILTATEGWLPTPGETAVNLSVTSENTTDLYVLPENFEPTDSYDRVHDYSDYSVDLQLCDANGVAMTSTHVKGSPYIFLEFGDREAFYLSVPNLTSFFDDNGNSILTESGETITTDHIGVHVTDNDNELKEKTSNSYYCIALPEGTKIKNNSGKLKITFPGTDRYASVGTMQSKSDLKTFYQHGYAFVTDTSVTYKYSENLSKITSYYDVTTEVKRAGFSDKTMQLMLPHQWKYSAQNADTVSTYTSVRGDLHGIWANSFQTVDTFEGLLPIFAMPNNDAFDQDKVLDYLYVLDSATANLTPAADAYWEGKNLHPLGMGVLMADQLGETELRDEFLSRLKKILVNWFTYDGPDDVSFLIYDTTWGTLYYKASEFGANWGICDHHFTYGYFMFAATILATYDEEFYNDYKDMMEMLMRDYANPADDDSEYCRFRSYDLYEGHSWAGGYADNDNGNNQESASESLFSWVAMYLWGVLAEDDTYRDAGIFGFTNEMETIKQYWFDYDKDNWVEDWPYEVVAQVYGGGNFYGTFFGGQPLYCYGIQWLPVSEYLTYYGMNQERAAEIYQGLLDDTEMAMDKAVITAQNEGKSEAEIEKLLNEYPQADTGWQHITWPFLSQTNPALALAKFEANVNKVQRNDQANTYWFIHSMMQYGVKSEEVIATGDVSATVYYNDETDKYTANVWNPCNEAKTVTFINADGKTLGTATVEAKALVSFEVNEEGGFAYTQVQTPVFRTEGLADGKVVENVAGNVSYDDTQLVTISSPEPGATIYYTTDGTVPSTSSPVYAGAIMVSSTSTLKAIAVKDGYIDSTFAALNITIDGDSVKGSENLALGKNATASSLQAEGAAYAASNLTDGNSGSRWASLGGNDNEWIYVDLGQTYSVNTVKVNWEAAYASEYEIQVSTNGNDWTTVALIANGAQGEREISFAAVNARYVKMQGIKRVNEAYGYSLYEMEVYGAVQASAPTITPAGGTYDSAQTVTMSTTVKGAEIKYTLDGSTPTEASPSYVAPFKVDKSAVVKAVTYRKGMTLSEVTEASIIIKGTVALSASEMVVAVGNSKNLTAITDGAVTWSSSDSSVATVDSNGKVTGVKTGTATITAKVGNNTATCVVTVKEAVKIQSLTLSSTELTMKVKSTDTLTATIAPANTTDDTTLTWTSSDSSIAEVNNGVVTAKKEGTAVITVICSGFRATCTVTVEPKYTIAEKLVNPEYNVLLDGATLYESGRFEGQLSALTDKKGFGSDIGGNWASQTAENGAKDAFIIIDLKDSYTLNQIEAMYIQWKNNMDTLPTEGFKIQVANDTNFDITLGTGNVAAGGEEITVVETDNSNWTTVFDSVTDNATNAGETYDWEETSTGCLSILPFSNSDYTDAFNHIKISFNYESARKAWGYQAYEIALLINDEEQSGSETPSPEEPKAVVEINGFQISTTVGGSRTVYSVEPEIDGKAVVERGLVYGLGGYASKDEMYVGADTKYVKAFAATSVGKLSKNVSESSTAESYAMTMIQNIGNTTVQALQAEYYVRVYAKLEDGTYVYSDVESFSVYGVADYLYKYNEMNTEEGHNYLYNNILVFVNKEYPVVEYDWNNAVTK